MRKDKRINEKMSLTQITNWTNQIIEPFSLRITGKDGTYKIELLNDILELIRRKNARGKTYEDAKNLLNQPVKRLDPFQDDVAVVAAVAAGAAGVAVAAGAAVVKRRRAARELDTSLLDVDVVFELAEAELGCCLTGNCHKCKPWKSTWHVPHVPCEPICHPESLLPEDD